MPTSTSLTAGGRRRKFRCRHLPPRRPGRQPRPGILGATAPIPGEARRAAPADASLLASGVWAPAAALARGYRPGRCPGGVCRCRPGRARGPVRRYWTGIGHIRRRTVDRGAHHVTSPPRPGHRRDDRRPGIRGAHERARRIPAGPSAARAAERPARARGAAAAAPTPAPTPPTRPPAPPTFRPHPPAAAPAPAAPPPRGRSLPPRRNCPTAVGDAPCGSPHSA